MDKYAISTFNHTLENKPVSRVVNLATLVNSLLTPIAKGTPIQTKKDLPLWTPTTFQPNKTRSGASAVAISCLVYDMDDGLTGYDTWRLWADWTVLAHTSFSNRPQHNKYRIILPLAEPIPAEDWPRASIAAKELWDSQIGRGEPDSKALKDVARLYYRYAYPLAGNMNMGHPLNFKEYHYSDFHHAGRFLKLDYSHVTIQQPTRYIPPDPGKPITVSQAESDPNFRMGVAHRLGAKMLGNNARHITCPKCGRPDVHFSIDINFPNSNKFPSCNHKNSCGWWGSLTDLVLGGGK